MLRVGTPRNNSMVDAPLTRGRHLAAAGSKGGTDVLVGVLAVELLLVVVAVVAAVGVAADVRLGGLLAGQFLLEAQCFQIIMVSAQLIRGGP